MLISGDASQIEWRTAIELSGDKVGLHEVAEKLDAHSLNQEAFNLPSRLIAKIYLFRTIFRGSGYAFSVDPQFSHVSTNPKYWDNVNTLFYEKYNGLDRQHKIWAELVMRGDPIITPFGREFHIPPGTDFRGEIKVPWTVLTNYPVQGTAADVMMLVRLMLKQRLDKSRIVYLFVSTVHDSIVLDIPNEEDLQTVVDIFHQIFDDLPSTIRTVFKYDWKTPLACEVKAGIDMKNMKEIPRST